MKKFLKWTGIVLGVLLLILGIAVLYLNSTAKSRLTKKHNVQPLSLTVPTDSASIAAGKAWASVMCTDCHGDDLGGKVFFDEPGLARGTATNLTPAGAAKDFTDADWVRAIHHGAGKDGRALFVMPSKTFQYLSAEHLGQIIAYMKTVPPVERSLPPTSTELMGNILFQLGAFGDILNVETIDHQKTWHTAPEKGVTVDYGAYITKVTGCTGCHGDQLNGGESHDPVGPLVPNITQGGGIASWNEAGFVKAMRTGVTPLGKQLQQKFMPYEQIGRYDDTQLKAMFAYLKTLPKLPDAIAKK